MKLYNLYSWGVGVAGWIVLLPLLLTTPPPPLPMLGAFVALAIASKWLMVPLPRGGFGTAGLAVVSAGLAILGPVYTALVISIGVVIGNGVLHRRPFQTTVFNTGQNLLAVIVAGAVFTALGGAATGLRGPLYSGHSDPQFFAAFLAAILTCNVVSNLFVSGRVSRRQRVPFFSVFGGSLAWELANDLAFAALGLVPALIYLHAAPVELIVLTIPLVLIGYVLMLTTTREQTHRELEVIERIGRASISLDLENLFQTIYDGIRQLMPADVFYVALYDAQHVTLTYEFLMDSGDRFPALTEPLTPEVWAILNGRSPRLVQLTLRDLSAPDPLPRVGHTDRRSASILFVPILRGEQVVGLLSAQSYVLNAYGEREVRFLGTVAAQIAAAIDNARLFETSARSVKHLTSLQQIANALAVSLKMDDVLSAILAGAKPMLGVDRCIIYLGNDKQGLTDVYTHGVPHELEGALQRLVGIPTANLPIDFSKTQVVEDVAQDQRWTALREMLLKDEPATVPEAWQAVKTLVSLPLMYQGAMMGVLVFHHTSPRPYNAEDLRLAQAIADQAATAVKNATLLTQTQQHAAEVQLMNRVLNTLTSTMDVDSMLRRIVEEISQSFGYTHVSIHRVDGDNLVPQAAVGYKEIPDRVPLTKGVLGRVARTGTAALVPDVSQDRDYIVADPAVRSEAAVPISADNRVLGVLNVETDSGRRLGESDLVLLQSLAGQVGVALRNATLFAEAQRSRDEITVLYDAAKAISSTLELESVLNNLVHVTCQAFGYEQGAILLVDDRSGDLVVEATYGYAPGTRGYRIPAGKGITGAVYRTGKPESVADVRKDARYIGITQRIVSEIAVPLISEARVIGVFNLESTKRAAFGPRDMHVLQALAGYATIAIENARLYEKTKQMAITDGLTELYNHRYLHETMERTLERCRRDDRPLAVIMLEIDSFKRYNDTYGHQRGDDVLRTVAELLRKGSRTSDIVARYGGDEFMIVLPYTSKETAAEIAERLRRAVEAYPFLLGESVVSSVTLSVGVAANPDDGATVDALVDAVDRAQYAAKRSGGNKVSVAHSMKETATG